MKQRYFIPTITTLAFIGLILIQVDWLQKVWETEKQSFENQLPAVYKTSVKLIEENAPTMVIHLWNLPVLIQDSCMAKRGEEWLRPKMANVLSRAFRQHELSIEYEYAVWKSSLEEESTATSKVIFTIQRNLTFLTFKRDSIEDESAELFSNQMYKFCSSPSLVRKIITSPYQQKLWIKSDFKDKENQKQAVSLALYFPNLNQYLLKKILPQIATSLALFLLLSGCFIYTLITLQKQRKLTEMKNDFINNLTHEFKTPLFSISLASEVLRNSEAVKASDKLSGYVNLIDEENQRLKQHLERVLQLVLLDEGKFQMEYQQIDMHELIGKVVNSFELIIQNRQGHIELTLQALETSLMVDSLHISQVIYNLIDNAIKYSPEAPDILVQTEDTADAFVIRVIDRGMGIKPKDLNRIFEKFYRVSEGDLHQVKGFGLGLHYSKRIIEAHGGEMRLNSEWGEGTSVEIVLWKDHTYA